MGAPSWDIRNRGVVVLASGVVVAMTALNVGLAPAIADPGDGPGSPTTTVAVPEPEAAAPEKPQKSEKPSAAEQAPAAASTPAAPSAPPAATAPEAEAPQTQAPKPQVPETQAPKSQEPEPAPETQAPKPAPETQAPKPPTTTATSVAPPAAPEPQQPEPQQPEAKSTTPAPSSALAPATTTDPAAPVEKSGETATAATAPTSAATESRAEQETSSEQETSAESEAATTSVSQAAREIEPVAPETAAAPAQDIEIAKTARVVEQPEPVAAEVADVAAIARIIDVPILNGERRGKDPLRVNDPLRANDQVRLAGAWDRNVRQWSPDWVQYDDYYRPVFANPYRDPVKIIYVYQNAPRILMIPPLSRIVLEVAQYAAYSFTAVVMNTVNTAVNVAVGSFFGGGYFPGIGLPLPPPPPPLLRYDNVPVFVNYSQQRYEPFRVQRIIDVGNDARYGERKVLLDGVTPAWGQWTQTSAGERQFEVHRTQQFPGLDEPREAPLPGDYNLRLASDDSGSHGFSRRDAYLAAVAILCAVLSAGAVMLSVAIGRRRNA